MRSFRWILLAAALVAATLALVPASASARTARCEPGARSGPLCTVWTGKVTFVDDGDTIDVDLDGDRSARRVRVRITGLQAMEQTAYSKRASKRRGECHALAATARLDQLIRRARGRVRLAAQDPRSRSGKRLRRAVAVRIGGRWRDVARTLMAEGHTLWLSNAVEYHDNGVLSVLAERAAHAGIGIWDPDACGRGPHEHAGLRVTVNWDADGNDFQNPNGEWVRISNPSGETVSLAGWWIRDSDLRRYRFPSWAVVPPRGTIKVHVGKGTDSPRRLHWGLSAPAFENASFDDRAVGDGAYLFDPQGDLRAWMTYPCRSACANASDASVDLDADPRGDEEVTVRNRGGAPLALGDLRLESFPYAYEFEPGAVLVPGGSLRLAVGGSPDQDTPAVRHWGMSRPILDNPGDVVRLVSYRGEVVACHAWGRRSCT